MDRAWQSIRAEDYVEGGVTRVVHTRQMPICVDYYIGGGTVKLFFNVSITQSTMQHLQADPVHDNDDDDEISFKTKIILAPKKEVDGEDDAFTSSMGVSGGGTTESSFTLTALTASTDG